ncbi:hypothetical protein KP79_PYT13147 [Mizuhopecten yessoensis]|uniref:Uncharacterized protein n=1 Tax=Mizuhopecten yessoensis TaxID=6573 RepID=A0A210PXU1_MIZYE|nr:hypothetical protein KP79_PYT13147 [Mizuhopecten yessoensis]
MPTYSGKERWEPFDIKFEIITKHNRWSDRNAFEYADKLPRTLGFTKHKKNMKERFSDKDVPVVASRELHFTKQEENGS